jgi:hypothetical protein
MCRLLSYRSLNGLVRNHRPDGEEHRKWRYDGEQRSSTDGVKVGNGPRLGWPSGPLSYRFLRWYTWCFVRSIAPLINHSAFDEREGDNWMINATLLDRWMLGSRVPQSISKIAFGGN